jgi:hypothetical protein
MGVVRETTRGERAGYGRRPCGIVAGASLLLLLAAAWSSSALAQTDPCTEPTDAEYLERMAGANQAVLAGDYALTLTELEWARAHYSFAVLDYGRARAFHRLQRYDEAVTAYDAFLAAFERCADPNGLRELARQYQQEAASAAARLEPPDEDEVEEDIPDDPAAVQETEPQPAETDEGGFHPGLILASAGGALVLGGLVFDLAYVSGLSGDKEQALDDGDEAAFNEADAALSDAQLVDGLLYGVGLAVALGGVLWWVLDEDVTGVEPARQQARWGVVPAAGGGRLVWTLTF